jgi:hypothetical protein
MLVVCAAVGVAIAGVPHSSHEPAIRLSGDAGPLVTDPTPMTEPDQATTTSAAPSTTAPTTTTTKPPKTTTTRRHSAASPTSTTGAVATTVAKSSASTVGPTGLNPDGR